MRKLFAVLLTALCFLAASGDAQAGPVRKFIQKHRPGILIPKGPIRIAPSAIAGPVKSVVVGGCANGVCPLPKK